MDKSVWLSQLFMWGVVVLLFTGPDDILAVTSAKAKFLPRIDVFTCNSETIPRLQTQ